MHFTEPGAELEGPEEGAVVGTQAGKVLRVLARWRPHC